MGDIKVRVPILEIGAIALRDSFANSKRPLYSNERKLLLDIFGNSVNLDPVEVVYTGIGAKGRPYTFGNSIRVPRGTDLDAATLVHEMTHVWQYQTRGTGYLSDSALHQLSEGQAAYNVTLVPGKSFYEYPAEQEAMIVEKYYQNSPAGWRTDPEVVRMLEEVRSARPLAASEIQRETWTGSYRDVPNDPNAPQPSQTVPLFRIEW